MTDLESAADHKRPAAGAGLACNPDEPAQDSSDDSSGNDETLTATYDNGIELIKGRVSQLGWEDMERLTAGMLKVMGYCTRAPARPRHFFAITWRSTAKPTTIPAASSRSPTSGGRRSNSRASIRINRGIN